MKTYLDGLLSRRRPPSHANGVIGPMREPLKALLDAPAPRPKKRKARRTRA